ncbi:hypothetical protein D3C76_03180 [compost metagenome]
MSLQDIYKIRTEMKRLYKKYELLNRKQSLFGLTPEEEISLNKFKIEWAIFKEEMIEAHFNMTVFPYLLDADANKVIDEIRKIVPWNGGFILRDEELLKLSDAEKDLTDDQKSFIEKKIEYIHKLTLQNFEEFCSTDEGWEYMNEVSKVITNNDEGNIIEVVSYLDMRYRDFAEILGIKLEEVEIYFDEGE